MKDRNIEHKRIGMAVKERNTHTYLTGNTGYQIFSIKWNSEHYLIPFTSAELQELKTFPYIVKKTCWNTGLIPLTTTFCFLLRNLIHTDKVLIIS